MFYCVCQMSKGLPVNFDAFPVYFLSKMLVSLAFTITEDF